MTNSEQSSSDRPLRTGVIGLGLIGSRYAQQLVNDPRIDLVALVDVSHEQVGSVVHKLPEKQLIHTYSDYNDMFRQEHLDLVAVVTPDALHRDPIVSAAQAGVSYIVSEKPLATSLSDAQAIAKAVTTAGSTLMVNFDNRSAPLDLAVYHIVHSGLMGDVVYGDSHLDDNISVPTQMWGKDARSWREQSSSAYFLLSHVVDLVHWYLEPDDVVSVQAIAQRRVLDATMDVYDAWLHFRSGAVIRVKSEWNRHMEELVEFGTSLTGSKGGIVYHKLPGFGSRAGLRACFAEADLTAVVSLQDRLAASNVRSRVVRRYPRPSVSTAASSIANLELEPLDQMPAPKNMITYFLEAIQEHQAIPASWQGNGSFPYLEAGMQQVRVIQALVDSAATGHTVTLA